MSDRKVGTASMTPAGLAASSLCANASTSALRCQSTRSPNSTITAVSPAGRNRGCGADAMRLTIDHSMPRTRRRGGGHCTVFLSIVPIARPLCWAHTLSSLARGPPMATINLNADIAEGWGAYDIGNDAELMRVIKSASVACGFHAGDANTMHRLCMLAKDLGVSVGAHPGFNDLWGFGRRRIQMKPQDLELMVAYQIGALQAMAAYAGLKVTHLKAHGALNNMAAEDAAYAMAIGRAIQAVDRNIIYVALYGTEMQKAAEKLGLPMALEGFPDRRYADDGNLAARAIPGSVLKDPK